VLQAGLTASAVASADSGARWAIGLRAAAGAEAATASERAAAIAAATLSRFVKEPS
jgi:hypothetical protein